MGKRGNGEGSITRRKDGRWWGRHTVHTPEGPKQRAVYGKTRADVAAKLRKAMSEVDNDLVFDAGSVTVGQYLNGWLSDSVLPLVEAGKLEHSTYVRYAGSCATTSSLRSGGGSSRTSAAPRCAGSTGRRRRASPPLGGLRARHPAEGPQAGRKGRPRPPQRR